MLRNRVVPLNKQRLIEALAEYDASLRESSRLWDNAISEADVAAAQKAEEGALSRLRDVFYEVTQEINNREQCQLANVEDIRLLVAS